MASSILERSGCQVHRASLHEEQRKGVALFEQRPHAHRQHEIEYLPALRKQIREDTRALQARYGIRPDMRRHSRTDEAELAHVEKLNLLEARASLPTLRHELAKYPHAFLMFCQLRRLRLVKSLQTHVPSLQGSVCYAGRTFHQDRSIYLATSGQGLYSLQATVHHELFHLSDSAQLQREAQDNSSRPAHRRLDPAMYQAMYDWEWAQLNPQGQQAYVGEDYVTYLTQAEENELPGFALAAGTIDPWEDRATIAGLLLAAPAAAGSKAQHDPIFHAKLTRIKRFYQQRSSGQMNERYFSDLDAGKVTEEYWKLPSG